MMRSSAASLTLILIGAAHAPDALAQDDDLWYATAFGGLVTQSDQRLSSPDLPLDADVELRNDTGFAAGAALGRHFGQNWRLEAEFVYQSVDHDVLTLFAGGPEGDGNYASTSVALNGYYDFNLFESNRARTYVGAGLVYLTEVDVDFEGAGGELSYSGSDTAAQLLLGVRYTLAERAFLDVGLRYLLASDVELDGEAGAPGRLVADYEPLGVTVGIGWRF